MDLEPFTGELDVVPFNGELDDDNSWMNSAKGTGEALLGMASQMPGQLAGGFNYLATLAATQDPEAALEVKKGSEKRINDWIEYKPRTKAGKELLGTVGEGMHELNQAGGGALHGMNKAAGLNFDEEAMRAIGAAGTEMALNVVDPLSLTGAFGRPKAHAPEPTAREIPANKLEALSKAVEPEVVPFEGQLDIPHQQEMFPQNPYDVAGHVTAAEQGRPTTLDNPQGELFGGESLNQPSIPEIPTLTDRIYDNEIPYESPSLGNGPQQAQRTYGQDIPLAPDRLTLEPMQDNFIPQLNNERMSTASKAEAQRLGMMEGPEGGVGQKYREALQKSQETARVQAYKELEAKAQLTKEAHYDAIQDIEIAKRAGEIDYQHVKDVVGDKTLMAADATESMRMAAHNQDYVGVMEAISKNHTSAEYRKLADYLKDKLEGITIKLHDEPIIKQGERDVTGYFDPSTSTVGLSGNGVVSPHTVLHETVHALTSQMIQARPTDIRVQALTKLYDRMPKDMAREFPGIVNTREFIAEAFSNPEFQKYLKAQRVDNRSMWTRFVDGVKKVLGFDPNVRNPVSNALEHSIDLGKQIIEASDKPTRQSLMDNFKSAGMNNKLADMMAVAPKDKKPIEVVQNENVKSIKVPGLESAVSDFAFYDKPMPEILDMAKNSPDIPNTGLERASHQLQAGGLFESLKTRNPVVKYTYERITRAFQEATQQVKTNLTDPVTGLKGYMRKLSPEQKGEIHAAMMLHEGQRVLTADELSKAGFSESQIAYYNKYRELSGQFFKDINARREAMGLTKMDERVAHVAGRFMGDFSRMVFKEGKVVGRISGSTKWELERASKFIQEQHPDWQMGQHEYNGIGKGRSAADRFGGLMEAINFIEKADGDVKALMDSYRDYLKNDAVNYLNATRHAKAKTVQAGGVIGSEGHKPWLDTVKNAEEGMKAQLAYFEQGYQWMAMEKAVNDIKPMLSDEAVVKQAPNAVKWAQQYVDHAMGRNQGAISDGINSLMNNIGRVSGVGHSNILKLNANIKHLMMQKFMGLGNIPFTVTQLLQPFQSHPAMLRLLHNRGLEFHTSKAQLDATNTYINAILHENGSAKLSDFERAAMTYADQMGIFDVKMTDHTKDINVSKFKEGYDKLADINITAPEHLTRGMSFLFYSHILRDAGVPAKDIFGAAENMTNMTMVNYHPIERPMGYAKLGWLGDIASTLTRYKHNQWSQAAFYAREGIRGDNGAIKSSAPLATFLGTSLAFGGLMGFFAFQEADAAYQLFMEKVMKKPDNLTNQVLNSDMPDVLTHGLFSTLGLDMTTRFSSANVIPDSIPQALLPYGSAVWDMAENTGRFVLDPTSETKAKQAFKSLAPQSVQGLLENKLFTEKKADGKNLYVNATAGPNMGRGRVERSDSDMALRAFGFRNIGESKELAQNYANSQIEKGHSNIVDSLLTKAKYAAMDDSLNGMKLQKYIRDAAEHGESPDAFIGKLTQWSMDRQLTQKQQQLLRNAQKGFKGAFNLQEQKR